MNAGHWTLALFPALVALAAPPAFAGDEPGADDAATKSRPTYDFAARALGGAFDGVGVHPGSGPMLLVELDLKPALRLGRWELAAPLRLDHRATFGANLDETIAGLKLDATYKGKPVEHGPLAAASYTWRPGWSDLYQPECGATGTDPCPTDRYSHSQFTLGYQAWWKLGHGKNVRAHAEWVKTTYQHDPNYDPASSVVHLAPASNRELQGGVQFRHLMGAFAYVVKVDAYRRTYDDLLSKNAGSGTTSRSNPVEKLIGAEPRGELQLRTKRLDASLGYGWMTQTDEFVGYYSYTGHHPSLEAKAPIFGPLSAEAKVELKWLTFGPNSKTTTDTEDHQRLYDHRTVARGALRYALLKNWSAVAEGNVTIRDTNFPDYVPNVYPVGASRPYDIQWDYTNWSVLAGVEWKP